MELHNSLQYTLLDGPVSGAADNVARVGTVVDMKDHHALEFIICLGTLTTSAAGFTVLVESSATNFGAEGGVADVDLLGTEVLASFDGDDDDQIKRIGYKGTKRYVRMTITPDTNSGAWLMCVLAARLPNHPPVTVN